FPAIGRKQELSPWGSGLPRWLARPPHPPVAGAQDVRLVDHLEAELAVETYVRRLVGLQKCDLARTVEIRAQCLHYPPAQSLALSANFHGDGSNVPMRLRQVTLFTRMQPASQAPELGQVWAEQAGGHAQAGGHRRPASARGCSACDTKQSISLPER